MGTVPEDAGFPVRAAVRRPRSRPLDRLLLPAGPDLTWLAAKVAAGVLTAEISWRGPWDKAPKAMDALLNRRLHGKAVLDIT
ncbi:hypothetical protein AB0J42_15765 [Nonomuraea sp. NPDC049649]|uniref:hypothetical protein n=1 Tax=Nonomuraea sp. NPDC049649 TaxID=3155776 RepID=UPI003427B910